MRLFPRNTSLPVGIYKVKDKKSVMVLIVNIMI